MMITNQSPNLPHIDWSATTSFVRDYQLRDQSVPTSRKFRYNLDGDGAHAACIAYQILCHGMIEDWETLDRSKTPDQRAEERQELHDRIFPKELT
jgi:hypothetical protein